MEQFGQFSELQGTHHEHFFFSENAKSFDGESEKLKIYKMLS